MVTKLFINIQPDAALFGEKDYQQLLVIRRLVHDLCMPVTIIGMPIVREADGLAMSSRNAYLTTEQRRQAAVLYQTLTAAAGAVQQGKRDLAAIEQEGMARLEQAGFRPEYFSIRRGADLAEPRPGDHDLRILVAAWLGEARLIDNIAVVGPG